MDGMYGAQCVDLTMAYTQYFGNYRMFGNAIDYLKNPLPKGWRRYLKGETTIAPGDIAIWQWGPWDYIRSCRYCYQSTRQYNYLCRAKC